MEAVRGSGSLIEELAQLETGRLEQVQEASSRSLHKEEKLSLHKFESWNIPLTRYPSPPKLLDMGLLFILVFTIAIVVGVMSKTMFEDDSVPEELSEEVIEELTGEKIDFSPASPEK